MEDSKINKKTVKCAKVIPRPLVDPGMMKMCHVDLGNAKKPGLVPRVSAERPKQLEQVKTKLQIVSKVDKKPGNIIILIWSRAETEPLTDVSKPTNYVFI